MTRILYHVQLTMREFVANLALDFLKRKSTVEIFFCAFGKQEMEDQKLYSIILLVSCIMCY